MLFVKSHGRSAEPASEREVSRASELSAAQSYGYLKSDYGGDTPKFGSFDYYFPEAPVIEDTAQYTDSMDALAVAMAENAPDPGDDSGIPPVFTYLGQFIDHDMTANTDRETSFSKIDVQRVVPAPRADVTANVSNLRMGALNLDSLYGGATAQGPFAKKLTRALRFPDDPAKLWIGTLFDAGLGSVPLPKDIAADLLRLDRLLDGPNPKVTEGELRALPEPLRGMFVNDDDTIRVQRAIIGDSRNDENLIVAQLHLAFARFHNQVVDEAHHHIGDVNDRDAVFAWARRMTTWHYQWLLLNSYLPTICDQAAVNAVLASGAPLYGAFLDRVGGQPEAGLMPMPLEFSVAAFRFGHSMVRASYDWSRFFGRGVGTRQPFLDRASFKLLFSFTGGASNPMPLPDGGNAPRLPSHWSVEWERLVSAVSGQFTDRAARKIDTKLALPLGDMENEGPPGVLRDLAKRNLRRGHRLNLPSAQDCIATLNQKYSANIPVLSSDQLSSGVTGKAVANGGFDVVTPLWFYVLKEAETICHGQSLGPLGSRLVSETIAGLIIHDPDSYWHQSGSDRDGRWSPADGVKPDDVIADSMPNFLRAAGVL